MIANGTAEIDLEGFAAHSGENYLIDVREPWVRSDRPLVMGGDSR
jgi:hypothetical protein